MNNLNQLDDLVAEYLLFRGFLTVQIVISIFQSYRSFIGDRKSDKLFDFNVEKIVDDLFNRIHK